MILSVIFPLQSSIIDMIEKQEITRRHNWKQREVASSNVLRYEAKKDPCSAYPGFTLSRIHTEAPGVQNQLQAPRRIHLSTFQYIPIYFSQCSAHKMLISTEWINAKNSVCQCLRARLSLALPERRGDPSPPVCCSSQFHIAPFQTPRPPFLPPRLPLLSLWRTSGFP